jgi:mannose-6-phosphate isomerase-like protein (cupin superfamily)
LSGWKAESRSVRVTDGDVDVLEQAVVECAPRSATTRATGEAEEVLFVIAGHGALHLNGERYDLEPETGANLGPGQEYELRNEGSAPMRMVSVRIREPASEETPPGAPGAGRDGAAGMQRTVIRRLGDLDAAQATTDRWYRIVADPSTGLRSATQFVGYIPTERAPDHFHTYDEVIYVIDGEGAFHVGGETRRIAAGSCIELPARTVHCLENTGADVMRLVAVFRPPGSPASAYYPDGTPAYPGTPL